MYTNFFVASAPPPPPPPRYGIDQQLSNPLANQDILFRYEPIIDPP